MLASKWVKEIRAGWCLGNSLDACGKPANSVTEMESMWGNPPVTRELINALNAAGFNALRVPVTWHKAADENLNIRADWLERVAEIIGWAVEKNMYVILNTHHDEKIFKFLDRDMEESQKNFKKIWEQIAERFKDFSENLAFEGLNEPRVIGSETEWTGGTEEERKNINILHQIFVNTVRAAGGKNSERVLIVTTHAASPTEAAQRALVLPEDSAKNKLIVSLHIYTPWAFALKTDDNGTTDKWCKTNAADTEPITIPMKLAHDLFISEEIPVIIGEMGALNRGNIDARAAWTEFFVSHAHSLGIPCFWWDSGIFSVVKKYPWGWNQPFGLIDRTTNEIVYREIVEAWR
jgi:endoglucanase